MLFWKLALQWRGHVRVTSPRLLSAILDYQQTKGNSTCTESLYLYLLKWWIFTRYFVVAIVPTGRIGCHVIDCLRNNNPRILTCEVWGMLKRDSEWDSHVQEMVCVSVCVCVCVCVFVSVCVCVQRFPFMVDITSLLSDLNRNLQGKGNTAHLLLEEVLSFGWKLALFERDTERGLRLISHHWNNSNRRKRWTWHQEPKKRDTGNARSLLRMISGIQKGKMKLYHLCWNPLKQTLLHSTF